MFGRKSEASESQEVMQAPLPEEDYGNTETQYARAIDHDDESNVCAPLSERFAALLIDLTLVIYACAIGYHFFKSKLGLPALDTSDWRSLANLTLLGAATAVFFLYFFLLEGILARTPGKLLCGLVVANRHGDPPGLIGVLIRNLLRPVDFVLFPLTGLGLAEVSQKQQRLGDFLGGTTIRRSRARGNPTVPAHDITWGSITRRTIALLLDLVVFAAVALFFLLCLPSEDERLTFLILQAGPILIVAYWVGCEVLLGGTPIKLLMGLRVVDEEARPVSIPGSLLRNLFRVLDHNPLGYLCAILSSRKQRPGDLAAQTSVILSGWSLRSILALLIFIGVTAGMGYYGMHNPTNFLRTERVLKVGPWTLPDIPSQVKYILGLRLRIDSAHFGKPGRPAVAEEPLYSPGEIVYLTATVQGFITENGTAWLQEDLLVTSPSNQALIDLLNVVNKRYQLGEQEKQTIESSFLLPLRTEPGRYRVRIRIRDRYGNMFGGTEKYFVVK